MLVLDASVVAKWFKYEEGREKALEIRDNFISDQEQITFPDLLILELANLLKFSRIYNQTDIIKAVESIENMDIDIVVPTFEVIKDSVRMAVENDLTVYDAVYISLAESLGCDFITADEKLHQKVKKLKFVKLLKNY
jgi:predicted nucleic acid-binding protein